LLFLLEKNGRHFQSRLETIATSATVTATFPSFFLSFFPCLSLKLLPAIGNNFEDLLQPIF
jgi:hypothetical protein